MRHGVLVRKARVSVEEALALDSSRPFFDALILPLVRGQYFPAGRQGIPLRKNKQLELLGEWLVVQQNLKSRTHPHPRPCDHSHSGRPTLHLQPHVRMFWVVSMKPRWSNLTNRGVGEEEGGLVGYTRTGSRSGIKAPIQCCMACLLFRLAVSCHCPPSLHDGASGAERGSDQEAHVQGRA